MARREASIAAGCIRPARAADADLWILAKAGMTAGAGIIHSGDSRHTHITWHGYGMPSTAFYCGCSVSIAAMDGRKTLR